MGTQCAGVELLVRMKINGEKAMKKPAPKLDQIDMFPQKKRGGYRGAHRPKGAGSTVMRIPNGKLKSVTELISNTATPAEPSNLKSVTEIKDDEEAAQVIHALRQYFRNEFMMGASDTSFEVWVMNTLETRK